jgi:hypothetical protein
MGSDPRKTFSIFSMFFFLAYVGQTPKISVATLDICVTNVLFSTRRNMALHIKLYLQNLSAGDTTLGVSRQDTTPASRRLHAASRRINISVRINVKNVVPWTLYNMRRNGGSMRRDGLHLRSQCICAKCLLRHDTVLVDAINHASRRIDSSVATHTYVRHEQ